MRNFIMVLVPILLLCACEPKRRTPLFVQVELATQQTPAGEVEFVFTYDNPFTDPDYYFGLHTTRFKVIDKQTKEVMWSVELDHPYPGEKGKYDWSEKRIKERSVNPERHVYGKLINWTGVSEEFKARELVPGREYALIVYFRFPRYPSMEKAYNEEPREFTFTFNPN